MDAAITSLAGQLGYLLTFAAIALESMGLPVPGESVVIITAVLAVDGRLPLWGVGGAAFLGSVIGGNAGYWIGRHGWRRVALNRVRRHVVLTTDRVIAAERFFEGAPGWFLVCLGRFVAALRVLSAPLAGVARMPLYLFVTANVLGSALWTLCLLTVVVVVRFTAEQAIDAIGWIGLAGLPMTALLVAGHVTAERRARRRLRNPR